MNVHTLVNAAGVSNISSAITCQTGEAHHLIADKQHCHVSREPQDNQLFEWFNTPCFNKSNANRSGMSFYVYPILFQYIS